MKIAYFLEDIPELEKPISLSIGIYDGVHLGHQTILKQLHKETRKEGSRVLLTFSNHPSTHLTPNNPIPLINSLQHRLNLLSQYDLDLIIILPFDAQIANLSYEAFFEKLRAFLPFDHLIVGEDARFGKGRAGGQSEIKALPWKTHYLNKETYQKEPISSGRIRHALEKGDLKKVKKMLGRPYSIHLPFDQLNVIQENEDQYKWVTGTEKLCLLPSAVYAVDLYNGEKKIPAIAFYRGVQTLQRETKLNLTLYFEKKIPPSDHIEIIFVSYLYNELDPKSSKASLLETLKPELSPS